MKLWEKSFNEFKAVASPLRTYDLFHSLHGMYDRPGVPLSTVGQEYYPVLSDLKTAFCIIDAAVDDACDVSDLIRINGGEAFNKNMLDLLYYNDLIANGTFGSKKINAERELAELSSDGVDYYKKTHDIMVEAFKVAKTFPRYEEFSPILYQGINEVGHSMEFSYHFNKGNKNYTIPEILENRAASMMVPVHYTLDIMTSPTFEKEEIVPLMEVFSKVNKVAEIGNTLNTWRREVIERDFSSPVLAIGLERGVVKPEDFQSQNNQSIVEKLTPLASEIEDIAYKELKEVRRITEKSPIKSVDMNRLYGAVDMVIPYFKGRAFTWLTSE
jgi:hypothetical protein